MEHLQFERHCAGQGRSYKDVLQRPHLQPYTYSPGSSIASHGLVIHRSINEKLSHVIQEDALRKM